MPDPGQPSPGHEAPLLGALVPPPQSAKLARKSVRFGFGEGSPHPHPPRPQGSGSRPRPPAHRTGSRGSESPQPHPARPLGT